jgi:hypothetical protein
VRAVITSVARNVCVSHWIERESIIEFSGDEKRIQAFFSELALETQSRTPRFEKLWQRAEASSLAPASLVTRFATVLAAIVVIAVVSLIAARSWPSQQVANIPALTIPTTSQPRVQNAELSASKDAVRPRRFARRPTERTAIRQAAVLSNWQSPTNILLSSPSLSVLNSLPQLNQSARDLEQFLP